MTSPLFVIAVPGEAAHLPQDADVLICGIGMMNAVEKLVTRLIDDTLPRPERIINVGTAGALKPGFAGPYEITTLTQHDFDHEAIDSLRNDPEANTFSLAPQTPLEPARLATGSSFIAADATRDKIAHTSDLVDMEGYAIARVARAFGIPVTMVKVVSDSAGEGAEKTWEETLDECARTIAETAKQLNWI